MTNQEIWNLLCETHNQYRNNQESLIQSLWESYLSELFGYKKILGEIVPHPSLVIGSSEREIPDILIQKNNEKLFLVELKQYSIPKNDTIEKQLLTYLTHTDMHLSIGILVCEKLYIYCYDFSTNSKTNLEIPFEKDNENGIQFIEHFSRDNFDEAIIRDFVNDANSSVKNVADIRNSITPNLIIELLKQHFIENYDEEDFTKAIKDLVITVSKKTVPTLSFPKNISERPIFNYSANTHSSLEKSEIIQLCHKESIFIDTNFTKASLNTSSPRYWANPNKKNLQKDWWLVLVNNKDRILYIFKIPAFSIDEREMKYKTEVLIDLQIYSDLNTYPNFTDSRSKINFKQWLIKEIPY